MNQKYFVKLTSEDRTYLEKLVSTGNDPARKVRRARILLKSDCSEVGPNWTYEAICDAFDVNALTVTNVRKAFAEGGLAIYGYGCTDQIETSLSKDFCLEQSTEKEQAFRGGLDIIT